MVGSWRLVAAGGWRRLVADGWWRLVVGGWWRLAVDGSWRLAVGGPLGRSLRAVLGKKKKISSLKDPPATASTVTSTRFARQPRYPIHRQGRGVQRMVVVAVACSGHRVVLLGGVGGGGVSATTKQWPDVDRPPQRAPRESHARRHQVDVRFADPPFGCALDPHSPTAPRNTPKMYTSSSAQRDRTGRNSGGICVICAKRNAGESPGPPTVPRPKPRGRAGAASVSWAFGGSEDHEFGVRAGRPRTRDTSSAYLRALTRALPRAMAQAATLPRAEQMGIAPNGNTRTAVPETRAPCVPQDGRIVCAHEVRVHVCCLCAGVRVCARACVCQHVHACGCIACACRVRSRDSCAGAAFVCVCCDVRAHILRAELGGALTSCVGVCCVGVYCMCACLVRLPACVRACVLRCACACVCLSVGVGVGGCAHARDAQIFSTNHRVRGNISPLYSFVRTAAMCVCVCVCVCLSVMRAKASVRARAHVCVRQCLCTPVHSRVRAHVRVCPRTPICMPYQQIGVPHGVQREDEGQQRGQQPVHVLHKAVVRTRWRGGPAVHAHEHVQIVLHLRRAACQRAGPCPHLTTRATHRRDNGCKSADDVAYTATGQRGGTSRRHFSCISLAAAATPQTWRNTGPSCTTARDMSDTGPGAALPLCRARRVRRWGGGGRAPSEVLDDPLATRPPARPVRTGRPPAPAAT